MSDAYAEGNALFVEEMYAEAIECYDRALEQRSGSAGDSDVADVHAKRAAACIKLHQYMAALDDANRALALVPGHTGALYRKGCVVCGATALHPQAAAADGIGAAH